MILAIRTNFVERKKRRVHLIEHNLQQIIELCKKYRVKRLFVFGSILTDRFNENSDIDFSVEFNREAIIADNLDWANLFFGFIDELQNLLKRKVDMVFDDYINNQYFRKELDSTKQLIYG